MKREVAFLYLEAMANDVVPSNAQGKRKNKQVLSNSVLPRGGLGQPLMELLGSLSFGRPCICPYWRLWPDVQIEHFRGVMDSPLTSDFGGRIKDRDQTFSTGTVCSEYPKF
jgi:hypothetical protein